MAEPTTIHDDREAVIDGVFEYIAPRALALGGGVREGCVAAGMKTDEPVDMSGDDYSWSLQAWRPNSTADEDRIDISVEIAEALAYGDEDQPYGVNFSLSIVEWGGLILGGLSPYNYTDEVWVDARDADAVAARWQILERADMGTIPPLCMKERTE
jgi:hypothetical protein